jgi:hypothetical protein
MQSDDWDLVVSHFNFIRRLFTSVWIGCCWVLCELVWIIFQGCSSVSSPTLFSIFFINYVLLFHHSAFSTNWSYLSLSSIFPLTLFFRSTKLFQGSLHRYVSLILNLVVNIIRQFLSSLLWPSSWKNLPLLMKMMTLFLGELGYLVSRYQSKNLIFTSQPK